MNLETGQLLEENSDHDSAASDHH